MCELTGLLYSRLNFKKSSISKAKINDCIFFKKLNGATLEGSCGVSVDLVFEVFVQPLVLRLFIALIFQFLPSVGIAAEQQQVNFKLVWRAAAGQF